MYKRKYSFAGFVASILALILLVVGVLACIPETRTKLADIIATKYSPAYAEIKDDNAKKDSQISALQDQIKKIQQTAEIKTGLFEVGTNRLIKSWDDLIKDGDIVIETTDSSKSLKCANKDLAGLLFCENVEGLTSLKDAFAASSLVYIDVSKLDTSNVTDMSYMFSASDSTDSVYNYDSVLSLINFGKNFDTSKVTTMAYMFYDNSALTSLDLSSFDTSNVITMEWMFANCRNLTSLDLSNFNTSKVKNMSVMFPATRYSISLNVSSFDTSNVEDMSSMFSGMKLNALDISNFDFSNVKDVSRIFSSMEISNSLNLGNFDISNVVAMNKLDMFRDFKGKIKFAGTIEQWQNKGINYSTSQLTAFTMIECSDGNIESDNPFITNPVLIASYYQPNFYASYPNYIRVYEDGTVLLSRYPIFRVKFNLENGEIKTDSIVFYKSNWEEQDTNPSYTIQSFTYNEETATLKYMQDGEEITSDWTFGVSKNFYCPEP